MRPVFALGRIGWYRVQLVLPFMSLPPPLDSREGGNDGSLSECDKYIWFWY